MKPNKPLSNPFGIQETFDYAKPRQDPFDNPFAPQQVEMTTSPERQQGFEINQDTYETDLDGNIDLKGDQAQLIRPNYQGNQSKFEQINLDDNNDPPLLEDLDITDPKLIRKRIMSVLLFKTLDEEFLESPDLSGPFLLGLLLGVLVLLTGKLHFNFIYGFGISGWVFIYLIMNFMSQDKLIDLYKVLSILGYGLAPVVVVALINVFINLKGTLGLILAFCSVVWATVSASKTFDLALGLDNRKLLIAYPIFLFYFTFILISVY